MVDLKFCEASASIWQYAGYVLFALKIVVPLIIIILGIVDFTKAVTSNKDDMTTNALKSLIIRVVIGVAIFFIPLIIRVFFSLISDASEFIKNGEACRTCLLSPFSEECSNYKAIAQKYYDDRKNNAMTGGGTLVTDAACYYCNHEYIWTNTPDEKNCYGPIGPDLSGQEMSQAVCENKNNDDNNKQETNTAPNEKDKDKDDGGYTPGGTTPTPDTDDDDTITEDSDNTVVIYVGDTRMGDICKVNNIDMSNCFYAEYNGFIWLNGDYKYGEALKFIEHTSSDPINDIKSLIENNSSTKYTIVVNLGIYDLKTNYGSKYVRKYISLAENEWKKASIVITQIAPVFDNNNYLNLTNTLVTNFNNSLKNNIDDSEKNLENLKYCSLQLAYNISGYMQQNGYVDMKNYLRTDEEDSGTAKGILFNDDGNKIIYNKIQECLK